MRTALILEEDGFVARAMSKTLHAAGWSVLKATTPSQALTMARLFELDLLIADVTLEGTTGALAKQILASRPDLEVLYISEYSRRRLQEYLPGADRFAFLQMPFSTDSLLDVVASILPRETPPVGATA